MQRTVETVPVEKLYAEAQVRRTFIETELRQLGESLKRHQVHPVIARRVGLLIDGERRWRAAKLVGLATLDVIFVDGDVSPAESTALQLVSAIHRESLTGAELWQGILKLLADHPTWTQKQAAAELGLSEARITQSLSPSKCVQEVQDALMRGEITLKHTYDFFCKLPEDEQRAALVAGDLTRESLATRVRKARIGDKPSERQGRMTLLLTCGRSVTVAGPEATLNEHIETVLEALKHMKKADADCQDGKTLVAILKNKLKGG